MKIVPFYHPYIADCDHATGDDHTIAHPNRHCVAIEDEKSNYVLRLCIECVFRDFGVVTGVKTFVQILGSIIREAAQS